MLRDASKWSSFVAHVFRRELEMVKVILEVEVIEDAHGKFSWQTRELQSSAIL